MKRWSDAVLSATWLVLSLNQRFTGPQERKCEDVQKNYGELSQGTFQLIN
jgi:hypothetical protein